MPQARYAAATPPGTPISGTDTNGTTTEVASISITVQDVTFSFDSPVLRDDFNRADSSSLGANWAAVPSLSGGSATMGISSNQAIAPGLGIFYANVWFNNTYSSNEQVSVTLGTVDGSGTAQFQLLLQVVTSSLSSNFTGYSLNLNFDTSSSLTASLYRFNSGTGTPLPSISAISYHSGSVFTFRKNGNLLYFLVDGVAITGLNGYTDAAALNTLSTLAGFGGYNSATLTVDNFYVGGLSEEVATVFILNQSKSGTDSGTGSDTTGTIKRVSADTGSATDYTILSKPTADGLELTSSTLLDDFNRANAGTLGGNWTIMPSVGVVSWSVLNNEAKAAGAGLRYSAAWNAATFDSNQEISVTIKTTDDISSGGNAELWLFVQVLNPGSSNFDGYVLVMVFNSLISLTATLYRGIANAYTTLQGVSSIAYTAGTTITLRKVGADFFLITDGSAIAGFNPYTDSAPLNVPGTYVGFGGYNSNTLTIDNATGGGVRKEVGLLKTAITSTDSGSGSDPESLNTGATTKSGTDTGTTSETATLTVAISTPDTGSGIEGTTTFTAAITGTETGTSSENTQTYLANQDSGTISEATALSASASNTDSGTDSEAATLTATASSSDSGTDSEAITLTVAITSIDTGTASDTGSVGIGSNSVTGTDTGTTSETTILTVVLSSADTGAGTDATGNRVISDADSGTGTEAISDRKIVLTDTGTDAEANTLTAILVNVDAPNYSALVLSRSPLLYWRFDEAVPGTGTAADKSGNSRVGTYVLSPITAASLLVSDSDASILFNGSTQCVTSGYNPFATLSTRSFEFWIKRNTNTSNDAIFGGDANLNQPILRFDATTDNISFWTDSNQTNQTWSSVGIGTGTVAHIVLTFNGSTKVAELYVNGVSKGTKTFTFDFNAAPGNFVVGRRSTAGIDSFDGTIDEPIIYSTILSSSEVLASYVAGASGTNVATEAASEVARPSSSDTGSDSEANVLTAAFTGTDTGTSSENTQTYLANQDSGTTSEATILVATASASDTGSGSDAATITASLTSSDTGTTSETGTANNIPISGSDTGSASDATSLTAAISNPESGSSSENGTISLATVDTGTTSETVALHVSITDSDSSTASEAGHSYIFLPDAGTTTETQILTVAISTPDTGTDSEAFTLTAVISNVDTGSGFDLGTNNIPVNTADTGTTTETATLVESATTADTGTETETSVLHASITVTDTGTDSESGSVAIGVINVSGTDTGTDSEAQTLAAAISDAQSGTSSETGSRAATSSDTGTSTETATLTATFSFADSGTTTETNLLTLRVQDFGTATELGYANLPIDGTETAHGTDTALLHAFITVTDTAHATEFAIKRTAVALLVTEVHVYRHWSYQVQVAAYTVSAHKHVTLTKGGKHYDYKVFKHTNEATKELVYR
jgi:hypothetical protein